MLVMGILLAIILLLQFYLNTDSQHQPEDSKEGLEEWMRMRYADPKTGKIPEHIQILERAFVKEIQAYERPRSMNARAAGIDQTNNEPSTIFKGPDNLGGRTRALAMDITDENVLLAGGVSGGLWRSEDSGSSWTRVTATDISPSVSSIAQDLRPGKENTWYYGTGEMSGTGNFRSPGDGIFKSEDGGLTWSIIESTSTGNFDAVDRVDFSFVNAIVTDPTNTNEDEVYAAVGSKIIRSTDGFETYEVVLGLENTVQEWTDLQILSDGRLIATIAGRGFSPLNQEGVFISENGTDWTDISPSGLKSSTIRMKIGVDPSNEDQFYILGPSSLHKYTFSSDEWVILSQNLPSQYETQNGYTQAIAIHPTEEEVIFTGGVSLFRSNDGFTGSDWQRANGSSFNLTSGLHADVHTLIFPPSNSSVTIAASDGGVARSEDNLSEDMQWEVLNDGYHTSQFYTVALNPMVAGGNELLGGTQDNGSWFMDEAGESVDGFKLFGGDGAACAISENSILVSSQVGNIVRIVKMGNDFYQEGEIFPFGDASQFLFINPFTVDKVNRDRVAIGKKGGVYIVDDAREILDENAWREISIEAIETANISALEFSVDTEGILVVGSTRGGLFRISNLRSQTQRIENISIDGFNFVSSISLDQRDADHIIVSNSNYRTQSIYYTTDGGRNWQAVGGNLEEFTDGSGNGPSVRWVEILPNGEENIYLAGTSTGLYMTETLNGTNTVWEKLAPGLIGNTPVDMMDVRPLDGKVVVGTYGNGIFEVQFDVPLLASINYSFPEDPSDKILLRANTSSSSDYAFDYQWLLNNEEIFDATSSEYLVNQAGTYTVRLTNTVNGQVSVSNPILLAPSLITSTDDIVASEDIKVLSNPSEGRFELVLTDEYSTGFDFEIVDINGRAFSSGSLTRFDTNKTFEVDLSPAPEGIYVLTLANGNARNTVKLFKTE